MGDFKITAIDPERKRWFQRVFNRDTIAIRDPVGIDADTPDGTKRLYIITKEELTEEVRHRYLEAVCEKYNVAPEEAAQVIEASDYVIDGTGCMVSIDNPQRWI